MELAFFQRKKDNDNCDENIVMGEGNMLNKLIVMDESRAWLINLTISQNF